VRILNEAADVVADDHTKNLINHRYIGLTANVVPEFGFNHREYGLNIAPLMIVAQKIVSTELVLVKHLLPQSAACAGVDALECDIGHSPVTRNCCSGCRILYRQIPRAI
jgi:hypothetical protein